MVIEDDDDSRGLAGGKEVMGARDGLLRTWELCLVVFCGYR